MGLLRARYLAIGLAAILVLALGFSVGLLVRRSPTPQGKVLVLLTVDLPAPRASAILHDRAVGLRLLPAAAGSSWLTVAVPSTAVTLPTSWVAPNSDNLFLEQVPAGEYRAAELVLRSSSGRLLQDSQQLALKVAATGLTPLLFTFRERPAASGTALTAAAAYGGNDEVNFGLEVAQGKVMSLPGLPLVDQSGEPLSLDRYRGKVVILASFLSECQETCPLVSAALLQLKNLLDQQHLQDQVQIVEVSQDPAVDTPAVLSKYQRYFSLPWPLLTGSSATIDQFWSQLKVPPIQNQPWTGPAPVDQFTGQAEPFNVIHASVVDVVNQQGDVVTELEDQPSLSSSAVPSLIEKYLDAQGHQQLKAGGSWTPQSLLGAIMPLLQQKGLYTTLPQSGGTVSVGQPAPDFSLPSSAGGNVALSQELGHPVVIDFWATWCNNCRADMRLVAQIAAQHKAQGLRVLLVDFQESSHTATSFLKGLGIDLPALLDRDGKVAERYGVPGLPVAVFVDRQGKVAAIQLGQLQAAQAAQDVALILGS